MARFERDNGLLIIELDQERLDAAVAPQFKSALRQEIADAPDRVILNLERVQFVDSTGLGTLVSLMKMMGPEGVLALAAPQASVRRLLEITKLDRVFRLYPTRADAKAALGD